MNEIADFALLPEGLHDELPPEAEHEAQVLEQLTGSFAGYGYERVKPPLVEFEESLLTGPGAGVGRHMFRLMDPISQRMMGVRADMTTQVARIAVTRLAQAPRPLRLFYSGQVLRVRGNQLRPQRQYTQAGVELIGADSAAADAEVVLLAADTLRTLDVADVSIDLTLPSLVPLICQSLNLSQEQAADVRRALDQKDGAAIDRLATDGRELFQHLMRAAGPIEPALEALAAAALPGLAGELRDRLLAVVQAVRADDGELALTADPGESRGFEYQTGVSFTLFARGVRGELGRGGRYRLGERESATGFTFYLDSLLRATPVPATVRRVFLPFGTDGQVAAELRRQGWQTVRALGAGGNEQSQARAAGCNHLYKNGETVAL